MQEFFLFKILLGCCPPGRFTEQHDIFFGIGNSLVDLKTEIKEFWKEAPKVHIDAWRKVTGVNGFKIEVIEGKETSPGNDHKLFFINLGGYKPAEFEEFHYKMLVVAKDISEAIKISKQTAFFKHAGFKGAVAHVDDKYGIDVDDIMNVQDVLSNLYKEKFTLRITPQESQPDDELHLGYLPYP